MTEDTVNYDFFAPPRIAFGWGRRAEIGALAASLGRRAFLIHGSRTLQSNGALDEIGAHLASSKIDIIQLAIISREPEVNDVDRVTRDLIQHDPQCGDFVLAIGGGSAIDLGKAVAAMATNRQGASVVDYLEGVGRGLTITRPPLPVLAMPTTAGAGSEATKNAVISSYDPPFKKSLRSDQMVPRVVLVDPELSTSLPPQTTAFTGMDAITQLIESYISCRAKPISRALALSGLQAALPAIEEAVNNGRSRQARTAMAHAALLSGIALANSGLGMAHGVAAALGVHCRAPHGLACAVMLPAALTANREASRADLATLGRACLGRPFSYDTLAAEAFIERIVQICHAIGIPQRLSEIGVRAEQIPELVKSSRGNSMSGNPRAIGEDELTGILERML